MLFRSTGQIKFGPIILPTSRIVIFCHHLINLDNLIPRPIRINLTSNLKNSIEKIENKNIIQPIFGKSFEITGSFPNFGSFNQNNFNLSPEIQNCNINNLNYNIPKNLEEFLIDLNNFKNFKNFNNNNNNLNQKWNLTKKKLNHYFL